MKRIMQVLIFVTLFILFMGVVSANVSEKTITNDDTADNTYNTQSVSAKNNYKIKSDVKSNMRTDKNTTQNIKKSNFKNANVKTEEYKVNSWSELYSQINVLKDNSNDATLTLKAGGTFTATNSIIWNNSNAVLTIDGNGQTINGNVNQVFRINDGSSLVLKNITITNARAEKQVGGGTSPSGTSPSGEESGSGGVTGYNDGTRPGEVPGSGGVTGSGTVTPPSGTLPSGEVSANGGTTGSGGVTGSGGTSPSGEALRPDGGLLPGKVGGPGTVTPPGGTLPSGEVSANGGTTGSGGVTGYGEITYDDGAVVHNKGGHLTIIDSIFTNNYAKSLGGVIYNSRGFVELIDSKLSNNRADMGGTIYNDGGNTIIRNCIFNNNSATYGGAIYNNNEGTLNIKSSSIRNNSAQEGGAIFFTGLAQASVNVSDSNFTENKAQDGAVIYVLNSSATTTMTNNIFTRNKAQNNETLRILGTKTLKNNTYDSTDIMFKTMNLRIKDDQTTFKLGDNVELNFSIELEHPDYYDEDILEKMNKTIYINEEENTTTKNMTHTLNDLKLGGYTVYFTTWQNVSNNISFTLNSNTKITTETSYNYYEGVKNFITLEIIDESGQKGTVGLSVKDGDEYTELLFYPNVKDGYKISTEALINALENTFPALNTTYTINITYRSNNIYYQPDSKQFTLNIIKQRNTTITYDIINNTEKNLQINITIIDAINKTPIENAQIEITGDINKNTTSGILRNNTITEGKYSIKVKFNKTENYNSSETIINFNIEIDKDVKIAELEKNNTDLTEQLTQAQNKITNLNNSINNLTEHLEESKNTITDLNNTVKDLTEELKTANETITNLNKTINNLTEKLDEAKSMITNLNNTIKDSTRQLIEANITISHLNNTVNDLTEKLDDANGKINNLNNTTNILTQQLGIATDTISNLNKTVKVLTEKLNETIIEINQIKENNNEMTETTKLNTNITINPIQAKTGSVIKLSTFILDEKGQKVNEGRITFKINGITLKDENNNPIYALVSDGQANISYKIPGEWMKNTTSIQAVYSGSETYNSSRVNASNILNIQKGASKITPEKTEITAKAGQTITLRTKIIDSMGDNINTGKVIFKLNGKTITDKKGNPLTAKVRGGEATVDYTIPTKYAAKKYLLTAVYGDDYHERSEANITLTLEKKGITINTEQITTTNGKTNIKGTITDETGASLVTNTKLAIKINGKTILTNVNSTNGKIDVSFTTTLKPGTYELQITSGENGIYKTGKMTTALKI